VRTLLDVAERVRLELTNPVKGLRFSSLGILRDPVLSATDAEIDCCPMDAPGRV
jgi:hypothetical protein